MEKKRSNKYPRGSYVYYRDNVGDLIIAKVLRAQRADGCVPIMPMWFAPEPAVGLPQRRIDRRPSLNPPTQCIEKVSLDDPS
jgi:hypothetical protein